MVVADEALPAANIWHGDLEHFEAFCKTLRLDNTLRFVLEPFQRRIMADYFAGATETLVLLPKKNGKTTLMAALVIYHLLYVDEARCYVAAASRDQARLLYDHAKGFVNRSPSLQRRILVRAGTYELRSRRDEGFIKVLAADSDTADGVGPTLAIVDELHRHKSTALYDVFRDGLGARDGRMLTITTAGDDEDGPLGKMRAAFLALPGKQVEGRYTYARARTGQVMHEWALRPTDDLDDLTLVKQVNPLKSLTVAKLRERRDSPSMTRDVWARFACNVWTQSEDAAIATLDWAAKAKQGYRLPMGEATNVVIGIDLGWSRDCTALVPVGFDVDDDGRVDPDKAFIDERLIIIPAGTMPGPGDTPGPVHKGRRTDEAVIKAALRRLAAIWPQARYAIDPNAGGQTLAQWITLELCDGDDYRVLEYSQQPAAMAPISEHFAAGIGTNEVQEAVKDETDPDDDEVRTVPLYHPDHGELNGHARSAVTRWVGERWRFDKRHKPRAGTTRVEPRPIDGVIAGALAYHGLMAPEAEPDEPFVFSV